MVHEQLTIQDSFEFSKDLQPVLHVVSEASVVDERRIETRRQYWSFR